MDVTRQIQIAVARADLIVCSCLRWTAIIAVLAVILLMAILAVRALTPSPDPYLIDYDAPGIDITSEGPDDDFTEAYYRFGGETDADSNAHL